MTSAGYLRFPHICGDVLTFTADDDVWLAPASGGRGWRVSSDHVLVSNPRLSGDGAMLAWTSSRDGAPEVRVADVDGGDARRLTHWGDPVTRVAGWSPDGEVLAISATGRPFERPGWAHAVPLTGGAPRRLPFGPVAGLAFADAGTALLTGTWGREPAYWKRYRGGTAGRLWTKAAGQEKFTRVLAHLATQFASPMLVAGRLVFLSDHEGTGNLYSCALDGSGLRRHTDHDRFYARQAACDGQRVVYQCAGEIWLLDGLDAAPRKLDITLGPSAPMPPARLLSAEDALDSVSVDETGRASAVGVGGTVHWLTHRDGPARALSVRPDAEARLPQVLGPDGQVVWVTDADGADALEISAATGPGTGQPARTLAGGELGTVTELAASPDGGQVAAASRDGRLLIVDVASGTVRQLAASADGPVGGLSFSPDSAWLAWAEPSPRPLSKIRLARLADLETTDVTDGRFCDFEPVFTGDGRYLAFLSQRSFDPVYDTHSFDLSFPSGCRPYLVTLAALTPSPFGPLSDGRPVRDEGNGGSRARRSTVTAEQTGNGSQPVPAGGVPEDASDESGHPVKVDLDGLPDRVVSVPVPEARYSSLRAVEGGLAWLRSPVTGVLGEGQGDPDADQPRSCLERYEIRQASCCEIVGELDWFEVSGDGKWLAVSDHGSLRMITADRKDSGDGGDPVRVDLSRARFLADPSARRRHAFEQAGRMMRENFWVADMAGVDWDGVLAAYRPVLDRIRTSDEFADVLWEVFGETGTSHAYVRTAPGDSDALNPPVGLLGADLQQAADGSWQVARVLPGESSDPRARSPLSAPGAAITPGTAILSVDGQPVDPAAGPAPLLVGTARKPVELTVSDGGGEPRRVAIVPLASERRLRYQDWVSANRRKVREATGGRAGYLHVPDMMGEGWAHFHRDLRNEMSKDLLILDVRQNRGGHTSELVVEKVARRIIGWDVPRDMLAASYPQDAPRGPVITIADEFAGSDGDVITAAIRILGVGPVVGARTWGGVIGIDAYHELIDGTGITAPRYALWFTGRGWSVENYGVDPDVEVLITPDDWAAGRDTQLAKAIELGLEAVAARPATKPPTTEDRPSRVRPPLPPRTEP